MPSLPPSIRSVFRQIIITNIYCHSQRGAFPGRLSSLILTALSSVLPVINIYNIDYSRAPLGFAHPPCHGMGWDPPSTGTEGHGEHRGWGHSHLLSVTGHDESSILRASSASQILPRSAPCQSSLPAEGEGAALLLLRTSLSRAVRPAGAAQPRGGKDQLRAELPAPSCWPWTGVMLWGHWEGAGMGMKGAKGHRASK